MDKGHQKSVTQAKGKISPAEITCTHEDYMDTPFIDQLNKNETILIPETDELEKLSREELSALYHRYVQTVQYFCKRKSRLGRLADGGWDVCEEKRFRPKKPCMVYSFGINNDFSFDDAVMNEYGCHVYSFDPSMGVSSFHRRDLNYFYNIGIAAKNMKNEDGWQMQTYSTIKSTLGHSQDKILILKMDIELMEWDVLVDIIRSGGLQGIDQLLVEFHLNLIYPPAEESKKTYIRAICLLRDIYNSGFRIFWTHQNTVGGLVFVSKCKQIERANCHEVNFVRVK